MRILYQILLPSLFLALFQACTNEQITIDNTQVRLDTNGQIVDAHDGRIIEFNDTFYWYGTAYGNTNGFTTANHYVCYSSKDLKEWQFEGRLLPEQPEGVYYRPHVIYNAKTKKYVLWYNWYPQLWNGQFGVAVSDTPAGPFEIVNDNVNMHFSSVGLGDFGLYVDEDGSGYISYNTIQNHQVSVEKLADDYLSSTLENGGIIAEHMEAGTMFKRNEKYYLLTDYTCCFCNYGSGARVYVSDKPMTGYQFTGNINRYPGKPASVLADGVKRGTAYETLQKTGDQFQAVEMIFPAATQLNTLQIDLFTGNRPENCGDVSNPRVHPEISTPAFDLYTWTFDRWTPLAIEDKTVNQSALSETLTLKFKGTEVSRLKIVPNEAYPYDKVFINEIGLIYNEQELNKESVDFYITGANLAQTPIIPAQQTYVMKLNTDDGERFIWMGDLWGSASDNIKGHDYQFWSKPLAFYPDGTIKPMPWNDQWSF